MNRYARTNATIRLTPCRTADKGRLLLSRLPEKPEGAELFRVRDEAAAKGTLDLLRRLGREARILGSLQSPPEQLQTESWFRTAERPALVTVGSHTFPGERPDVRAVYVMNLPPSLADASADLAAAGGDGLAADAEWFASGKDRKYRLEEIRREFPESALPDRIDRLNRAIAWLEHDGCARVFLARELRGETAGVCGNCGWCLGRPVAFLPPE